ncbi:hypothetical protein DS745_03865 [Anaerobacillus alkaliphilus]|uniref:DUF2178 domain-containing protein n=1 Tax=Anaerobacillus alkaliphilus TaxID=1548597 RepID=A0A4Q0VY93_9BACI|nr:hypothetical protein [Anaerobacillus alkaliphilus]RXJ04529.1 hypothetical protein DS745_03865 [Anaerobacillus alkaliphilus]
MNWLLLIIGIVLLLLIVKCLAIIEKKKTNSMASEIKQNALMVPLGVGLILLIALIPYQVWVIFGRPVGWEIIYIFGFSIMVTVTLCFWYYYRQMKHRIAHS